jgi:hypothetical protein
MVNGCSQQREEKTPSRVAFSPSNVVRTIAGIAMIVGIWPRFGLLFIFDTGGPYQMFSGMLLV